MFHTETDQIHEVHQNFFSFEESNFKSLSSCKVIAPKTHWQYSVIPNGEFKAVLIYSKDLED